MLKYTILILLTIQFSFAQTKKIDSLKISLYREDDTIKIKNLLELGVAYMRIQNTDPIPECYNQIKLLSQKLQSTLKPELIKVGLSIEASSNSLMSHLNYIKSNFPEAINYTKKGLELYAKVKNTRRVANMEENLGDLYQTTSQFPLALQHYYSALKIYEQLKDTILICKMYDRSAGVYVMIGNASKTSEIARKALAVAQKSSLIAYITEFYGYIGKSYSIQSDSANLKGNSKFASTCIENALSNFLKALSIAKENKIDKEAASLSLSVGEIYFRQKKYTEALSLFTQALPFYENDGEGKNLSFVYVSLARTYSVLNKHEDAENYFSKAHKLVLTSNIPYRLVDFYENYSAYYESIHKSDLALKYYKLYSLYRDSIYNSDTEIELNKVESNYQFEKKAALLKSEQEKQTAVFEAENKQQKRITLISITSFVILLLLSILLLRNYKQKQKANELLAQQKAELEKTNVEKESLLKEIHHRVKNNLQVISGLLSLQNSEHQSNELKAILKEGQSRVKSMALIHQMLYQNQNLSTIPFQNYLEELSKLIEKSYGAASKKIAVNVEAKNIAFDVDTAIPLGLIVNELLSNSIKYAFDNKDEGGSINISIEKLENNQYNLTIKDNGKGIPDSFNLDTAKSLGLRLVKMLCTQMRAELSLASINGTQIEIKFLDTWKKN